MQKHVFAAVLLLTGTANAGATDESNILEEVTGDAAGDKWIAGHTCPIGKSWISTEFDKEKKESEQQAKAECAAACEANDLCAYADLFYTSKMSTCYLRTEECGDWETSTHHNYRLYIKGAISEPTPSPTDVPIPAPTNAPISEPTGDKWIAGHTCPIGKSWISTEFDKEKKESEQQAKAECAAACEADDLCAYADLFHTSKMSTCYLRTEECGDWETSTHHNYRLYIKGAISEPTPSPTDAPIPVPTNAPISETTGDKWIAGHNC